MAVGKGCFQTPGGLQCSVQGVWTQGVYPLGADSAGVAQGAALGHQNGRVGVPLVEISGVGARQVLCFQPVEAQLFDGFSHAQAQAAGVASEGVELGPGGTVDNVLLGAVEIDLLRHGLKGQSLALVGRFHGGADHIVVHHDGAVAH